MPPAASPGGGCWSSSRSAERQTPDRARAHHDSHLGDHRYAQGRASGADCVGFGGLTASTLDRIGLRSGEPMVICPPLFHGLGLLNSMLALFLGSPLVLARRYDAAQVLASVGSNRAGSIVAVPVMLQRMLDLGPDAIAEHDLGSLRAVISGASALGPALAERFIAQFGPVLCDAYGSSEIGIATIATSADLLAAPGTVGRPCLGSSVRILDADDQPLPTGQTGRIFAGGGLVFGGYSDGSSKTVVDGRMSTGDLGHLDQAGRLFVDGREDDMIVSGGENVYPVEVEDCLMSHPAVVEAVVVGVPDEEFGQRLVAYVVLHSPATEDELIDARARESRPLQGAAPDRPRRRTPPQRDRQGPPRQTHAAVKSSRNFVIRSNAVRSSPKDTASVSAPASTSSSADATTGSGSPLDQSSHVPT